MRAILATSLVSAILLVGLCRAEEVIPIDHLKLVVPNGSPVHFSSYDAHSGVASFDGAFIVAGTYHVGDLARIPKEKSKGPYFALYFTPDISTLRYLPYWEQYKMRATEITFDNREDFIRAAIPGGVLADFLAGKTPSISGHITIRADHYNTRVECDYPYFELHFLNVVKPAAVYVSQSPVDDVGC